MKTNEIKLRFTYLFLFIMSSVLMAGEFPVQMSSSTSEIRSFLQSASGSSNAKIVFVNTTNGIDGQLCYIDFSEQVDSPVVHKIKAITNAKVPVISPDGKWVVYASGEGGEAGSTLKSSVYICRIAEDAAPVLVCKDSAAEPRFMQNVPVGKDTVIFPTLSPNYAWEGFGKTVKVGIEYNNNTPVPGTQQVIWGKGSFTGGQSWDKRYLCGGGGTVAMLDLNGNGKTDTVTSFGQACNASITSSRINSNRMMYLTGPGNDPGIDNGNAWRTWQIIFISDINKKVIKYFKYPTTFKYDPQTSPVASITSISKSVKWHHPEWSNHPYFATATMNVDRFFDDGNSGFNNTNYQERIYLINLKDSAYLEVLRPQSEVFAYNPSKYSEGAGLYWPWLWVQIPDGFEEESIMVKWGKSNHSLSGSSVVKINGTVVTAPVSIKRIIAFDLKGKQAGIIEKTSITGNCADISTIMKSSHAVRLLRIDMVNEISAVVKYIVP